MSYLNLNSEEIVNIVERGGLDDDMFFSLYFDAKREIGEKDILIERLLDALENRNADDYVESIRREFGL